MDKLLSSEVERKKFFLGSKTGADCKFLVGGRNNETIFYGHKILFSISSAVFKNMLYGDSPEEREEIEITDIQPDTFSRLKEFIYVGDTTIPSVEDALALWYGAHKYDMNKLKTVCTDFLQLNIKPSNVCNIHRVAKHFNHSYLIVQCQHVISRETSAVLNHSSFLGADLATLNFIFDQDFLHIDSEVELFKALELYNKKNITNEKESTIQGNNSSNQENQIVDEAVKKNPLKDLVKKIRFLTMTPEEFADCTKNCTLLTTSEVLHILFNIAAGECKSYPMPDGFSTSKCKRHEFVIHELVPIPRTVPQRGRRPLPVRPKVVVSASHETVDLTK